jgi:CDGSH-type Zn-finger protein
MYRGQDDERVAVIIIQREIGSEPHPGTVGRQGVVGMPAAVTRRACCEWPAIRALKRASSVRPPAENCMHVHLGWHLPEPAPTIPQCVLTRAADLRRQSGDAGETIASADAAALCRCGGTANPPFCDGSHVRIGFSRS